jgi:hypothetical protein
MNSGLVCTDAAAATAAATAGVIDAGVPAPAKVEENEIGSSALPLRAQQRAHPA